MNTKSLKYIIGVSLLSLSMLAHSEQSTTQIFDLGATLNTSPNEVDNGAIESLLAQVQQEVLPHPNQCDFSYLRFNDIKYIHKYDSSAQCHLQGTSGVIHRKALEQPDLFLNLGLNITYPENGAEGPNGVVSDDRKTYILTEAQKRANSESRKNIIFSIDVEKATDITHLVAPSEGFDKVYEFDLIVFAHSDSLSELPEEQYFFKRVQAIYNLTLERGNRLSLKNYGPIIPLSQTDFRAMISLSGKKFILRDDAQNITKVFPITTGGFDIRSQIDGVVESMTLQVPKRMYEHAKNTQPDKPELHKEYQPFTNAFLTRPATNPHSRWNTEFRTAPSIFHGRPYLAFVDENLKDPTAEYEPTQFGYRLVALHDKIVSGTLTRSESSHGCQRMEDKNLYQVFAIVNYGPKDKTPIYVNYKLSEEFEEIDNLMTVTDKYKTVEYTQKEIRRYTSCEAGGSYERRDYINPSTEETFYTFADSGCGSSMQSIYRSSDEVYDYIINEQVTTPPSTYFNLEGDHYPVRLEEAYETLVQRGFPEPFLRAYAAREGANQNLQKITILERLVLSQKQPREFRLNDYLNESQISTLTDNQRQGFLGYSEPTQTTAQQSNSVTWPVVRIPLFYRGSQSNIEWYKNSCENRVETVNTLIGNCSDFYNQLAKDGARFHQ